MKRNSFVYSSSLYISNNSADSFRSDNASTDSGCLQLSQLKMVIVCACVSQSVVVLISASVRRRCTVIESTGEEVDTPSRERETEPSSIAHSSL